MDRMRQVIRANGEHQAIVGSRSVSELATLIGANTLDTVNLRHLGAPLHVMLVDDQGVEKNLPVNAAATRLYHANCVPGTTHDIRGDVVVVPDDDYAPS